MMRSCFLAALGGLLACGCGGGAGKVKGRLVENGQPLAIPAAQRSGQAAVQLSPVGGDGKPDASKIYTGVLSPEGAFEVAASGGEVPPGEYQISVLATGKLAAKFKALAAPGSPVRRQVKPGMNDLTIDIAKPKE